MRTTWIHACLSKILTTTLVVLVLPTLLTNTANAYTPEQQLYLDTKKALDSKQMVRYQQLRTQLGDYPLAIYLDYHIKIDHILNMPGAKARTAIEEFNTMPLYNSARYRYLMKTGSLSRWQDFLAVSPNSPNDMRLQCYYLRAQLATGDKKAAYKGADKLWLHGYSRPKECDPLFTQWAKEGYRTQELIWGRMLLSFNAGQSSLLSYLSNKITKHRDDAELLLKVYKDPNTLRHTKRFRSSQPIVADIVDAGLRKLARKDLQQAIKLYVKYDKANRFKDAQSKQLNHYLVRRALINQDDNLKSHIDGSLVSLASDELFEMRMRWAIRQQDLATLNTYLPLLSDQAMTNSRWQYWQAKMNADQQQSENQFLSLAQQRDFYGFNAAKQIKKPLSLNDANLVSDKNLRAKLFDDAGLARVVELRALDKFLDSRSEWIYLMRRHDGPMTAEYGLYALEQGWYDLSVESSIQGKQWDALNLRFPKAADAEFVSASKKYKVDINEIRAISRRESAFNHYATSGVGARGLMQLMPATAKQTAKKNKIRFNDVQDLYKPQVNVMLGSAYYAELLKQFDNNRVLATAAYNAGPGSVRRWLKVSNGSLDAISFIETIPFTETREYVQAVLSYRMIYQQQDNPNASMFTDKELNYIY
ncbi:transglycosylase SLT domain-containing protein [Shewanella sp. ULN5]|uniref:transglycosylase SLT domain-containing protein n=1 Tax=Shewanella sp. ULN5 TaxID=2994678 RepID=UPI00273FFC5D|nr:transglycosylase SLT domain-containing protein [Shewanella sp. ULN5]MDP5145563.1 transglycosylase SLT domain-containing protein [Shewanella sp. ULN5]